MDATRAHGVIPAALNEPCNRAHETRSRNPARTGFACFFSHEGEEGVKLLVCRGYFAARQLVKRLTPSP